MVDQRDESIIEGDGVAKPVGTSVGGLLASRAQIAGQQPVPRFDEACHGGLIQGLAHDEEALPVEVVAVGLGKRRAVEPVVAFHEGVSLAGGVSPVVTYSPSTRSGSALPHSSSPRRIGSQEYCAR